MYSVLRDPKKSQLLKKKGYLIHVLFISLPIKFI